MQNLDRSTHGIIYDWNDLKNIVKNNKLTPPNLNDKIEYNYINSLNTLDYLFYNIKVGVYCCVKDGKLVINYKRFNNINYKNDWHKYITLKDKYKDFDDLENMLAKRFDKKARKLLKRMDQWYAINCIIFNMDNKMRKVNVGITVVKKLLNDFFKTREVKDVQFCVNQLDHPVLKKDYTQPFEHLFKSEKYPLKSHYHSKYIPIFSFTTSDKYMDIPIPTKDCIKSIDIKPKYIPWKNRYNRAIFRGSSTGCGTTIITNLRLRISSISYLWKKRGIDILDAGITKWTERIRKYMHEDVDFIDPKKYSILKKQFMKMDDQAKYKYYVNIEGNGTAYRLAELLKYGFVVLDIETPFHLWFYKMLKPYVHYIPIKRDLSNLKSQIMWCIKNDKKCETISQNAKQFYDKYINKNYMFDYLNEQFLTIGNNF